MHKLYAPNPCFTADVVLKMVPGRTQPSRTQNHSHVMLPLQSVASVAQPRYIPVASCDHCTHRASCKTAAVAFVKFAASAKAQSVYIMTGWMVASANANSACSAASQKVVGLLTLTMKACMSQNCWPAGERVKGRLVVSFVNEQGMLEAGLDYGGLIKEFLEQVLTD